MWWCPPRRAGPGAPSTPSRRGGGVPDVFGEQARSVVGPARVAECRSCPTSSTSSSRTRPVRRLRRRSDRGPRRWPGVRPHRRPSRCPAVPASRWTTSACGPTAAACTTEHAVLARTPSGLVLLTAHSHAPGRGRAARDRTGPLPGGRGRLAVPDGHPARGARARPPPLPVVLRHARRGAPAPRRGRPQARRAAEAGDRSGGVLVLGRADAVGVDLDAGAHRGRRR